MSYLITSNTALTNVQFPTQEGMNNPSSYINQLQETHEIPINSDIATSSVDLPLLHNDPCDRLIIATALANSMNIITCDIHIKQYKEIKVIW